MSTNSGHLTETLHRQILMRPEVEEHPIGHTSKVYRYRTRVGHEFAVEKRRNYPVLLIPTSAVSSLPPFIDVTTTPAGGARNHNVNALVTFRKRPLLRLQVRSISDAEEMLRRIG